MRNLISVIVLLTLAACASAPRDKALAPITRQLCDKNVVLLGELPSHGEGRTFAMKASIAQELVRSCGFDTILFEAPIYDFLGFENAIKAGTATSAQLDNAIGRFWLTRELAPFRAWLFEQASAGRLRVGGIDDQMSATSVYGRKRVPEMVSAECAATVRRNLEWTYNATQQFDDAEKQRLQSCANAATSSDPMLRNFSTYVARQVNDQTARTRDAVMFDNMQWYRARKVIVWTATVHAARQQGSLATKPLGAYLRESNANIAAIGFTALRGQTSMAGRPAQPLADLPATSLEARMLTGDVAWKFLDHGQLQELGPLPSRLFGRITEANWADYFDGVVIIRDEVAPEFEPKR